MATTIKKLTIQGLKVGQTSVTLTTTKEDAVSAEVTININVTAKEVLTITATTTNVTLTEGQTTTVDITYSGDNISITKQADSDIAKVTLQEA